MTIRARAAALFVTIGCSTAAVIDDAGGEDVTTDRGANDATADTEAFDATIDVASDVTTTDSSDANVEADAFDYGDASCPIIPFPDTEQILTGKPSWHTSEILVYKGPLGDPSDASSAVASALAVLQRNHYRDEAKAIFKSANAHPPPYDHEFTDNIVDSGFVNSGCFALSDLKAPSGLLFIVNLVPSSTATTGISFEEPDGGFVVVFSQLAIEGELDIDDASVDPNFSSTFPKAGFAYDYVYPYDGFGHLVLVFGENDMFSPNPLTAGRYTFTFKLNDLAGNITRQTVHFGVQ